MEIEELSAQLKSEFKMKDFGEVKKNSRYGDRERYRKENNLFVSETVFIEGIE